MMFKKVYLSLLLFTPSIALAHGIPEQAMVIILVVWPMMISAVYGLIVLFLRWRRLFKYQWLTITSYILTIGSLGLLAVSLVVFGSVIVAVVTGEKTYFSEHYVHLFFLFLVVVLHIGIVTWLFRAPIKQYRQLADKNYETTNSISEALGIKDKK